jgi:hypothetical protein
MTPPSLSADAVAIFWGIPGNDTVDYGPAKNLFLQATVQHSSGDLAETISPRAPMRFFGLNAAFSARGESVYYSRSPPTS